MGRQCDVGSCAARIGLRLFELSYLSSGWLMGDMGKLSRVDGEGRFSLRNLSSGSYRFLLMMNEYDEGQRGRSRPEVCFKRYEAASILFHINSCNHQRPIRDKGHRICFFRYTGATVVQDEMTLNVSFIFSSQWRKHLL